MDSVALGILAYRGCENSKDSRQSSMMRPAAARSITSLNPHQQGVLQSIKTLDSCPGALQNKEALSSIRAFLSSPEIVCGLSLDKQLALRQKLAAAEAGQSESNGGENSLKRRLVYQDTIIPLVPLGGGRTLCPAW
jgi:hypothetical protein